MRPPTRAIRPTFRHNSTRSIDAIIGRCMLCTEHLRVKGTKLSRHGVRDASFVQVRERGGIGIPEGIVVWFSTYCMHLYPRMYESFHTTAHA